jgi:transposase-like protein
MEDFEFRDDEMRRTALADTKKRGTHCPSCKSETFYAHSLSSEGWEAWQWFTCNRCGLGWCEVYELARIEVRADND